MSSPTVSCSTAVVNVEGGLLRAYNNSPTLTNNINGSVKLTESSTDPTMSNANSSKQNLQKDPLRLVEAISSLKTQPEKTNFLEGFLRRNRQTITLLSVILTVVGLGWTFYQTSREWRDSEIKAAEEKAEKALASIAGERQDAKEKEKLRLEQIHRKDLKLLQTQIANLETSNNVINTIEVISRFSENLAAPDEPVDNEAQNINLPAFQSLKSLSTALLSASAKGKGSNKEKFVKAGRHICRILFAKCQHKEPSIAAAALATSGHVLNTCKMAGLSETEDDGKKLDETFASEQNSAFRGGGFQGINFLTVRPYLNLFNLDDCRFQDSIFPLGIDLESASLGNANFSNATLTDANFTNVKSPRPAVFSGATFNKCQSFDGANLRSANFDKAIFSHCKIGGKVNLSNATLTNLEVKEELKEGQPEKGKLSFANANMQNVTFSLDPSKKANCQIYFSNVDASQSAEFNFTLPPEPAEGVVFEPSLIFTDDSNLSSSKIVSSVKIAVQFDGCTLLDLDIKNAKLLAPQFRNTNASRAMFGKETIGLVEGNLPKFVSTDFTGADFSLCEQLNADWFSQDVDMTMARIPAGSDLATKLIKPIVMLKGEKDTACVIVVQPCDPKKNDGATGRIVEYINDGSDWNRNELKKKGVTEKFCDRLIKYLGKDPERFKSIGLEFHLKGEKSETTKQEKFDEAFVVEKLNADSLKLSMLKSPKWRLTTKQEDSPPTPAK